MQNETFIYLQRNEFIKTSQILSLSFAFEFIKTF